jgi:hypothetical protein
LDHYLPALFRGSPARRHENDIPVGVGALAGRGLRDIDGPAG